MHKIAIHSITLVSKVILMDNSADDKKEVIKMVTYEADLLGGMVGVLLWTIILYYCIIYNLLYTAKKIPELVCYYIKFSANL